MLKWPHFGVLGISSRDFALVFTLLFNAFTWSYMTLIVIESIPLNSTLKSSLGTLFYLAAAGAGLSGALLSQKVRRLRLLYFWMVLGVISSFLLMFMNNITTAYISIVLILSGISFGLGMPSSLAYFADNSTIENRGRISSLILVAANLSTLPLAILFLTLNPVVNVIILTTWRGLGLVIFTLLRPKEVNYSEKKKNISFTSILKEKSFFLYILPLVMFALVDAFEKSLLLTVISPDLQRLMLTVEPLVAVLFMLIGGLFEDRLGRKRMVIYGFISIGIGYAIVSLVPIANTAWYFYFVVDGAAWGVLSVTFHLILWGDLSQPGTREKYYAVGNFPLLIRSIIPLALTAFITSVHASAAFSLASFFLFMAVLPLMYAPETLSEKKIELRRVKGYVEQAKKLRDKYFEKNDAKKD
jgi:MFS family permease